MHVIPQSWSHLHILISVFPSVGFAIGLGFYIVGLRTGNEFTKRVCLLLFGLLALLSIPIYVSGAASMSALSENPRFSADAVSLHYVWGIATLAGLLIAGAVASFKLWQSCPRLRFISSCWVSRLSLWA